jgi:cytochrome c553
MKPASAGNSFTLGVALIVGCQAISGGSAWAADAAAGGRKSIFCAYCHGADGNPTDGGAPRLAGQSAQVLAAKMKRQTPHQNHTHPMLQAFITAGLNDADREDLAAYYAKQPVRETAPPTGGTARP